MTSQPVKPRSGFWPARAATMALLFCSGFLYATWGVHVPTVKAMFDLNDANLSVAMFAIAGGAIVTMSRMARWVGRSGSQRASLQSGIALAVTSAFILSMPNYWALVGWLALYGAANATYDVAVNAQAATLEARYRRPIMASLHGCFSLGGMAGALVGGAWLAHHGSPQWHVGLAALGCAMVIVIGARFMQPDMLPGEAPVTAGAGADEPTVSAPQTPASKASARALDEAGRRRLHRRLTGFGVLAFLGLVVEGAMYDWTAVYMREVVAAQGAWIGAGYAAFSLGMAGGRFGGDPVRARMGGARLLRLSSLLCVGGVLLALLWRAPAAAVAGFALAGLGLSNVMPVMFAASGEVARGAGMASAEAIAVMARLAYLGLLVGPVVIGAIAHGISLPVALGAGLLCIVPIALLAPRMLAGADGRTPQR
ncbi:MFS transporter [Pandoraea nosoerga]|uniref:MFS transporter n=1 Tax=Pandoraea nosoerga TaxID=2508296 RepID=A0A5E4TJ19_9BURK|nr:MFS transporter [Pandoraea nosoerga]MBN4665371.1 MFS transporter [Pandoraea nosoerga]MBN4674896.1 MFS transporter [Pandoraea nosoerga]MBN4680212.1 MFS transporter [Pandoraea nosoerga]MBN4744555.1 MFS transporter [Pandoraea nosoerga]VVD86149.1 MFS transporter [Pandoraea nosoerga]